MRKCEIRTTLRSILSFWCMQTEGHTNYIKQAPAQPIDVGGWKCVCPIGKVQHCGPAEKFLENYNKSKEFSGLNHYMTKFRL